MVGVAPLVGVRAALIGDSALLVVFLGVRGLAALLGAGGSGSAPSVLVGVRSALVGFRAALVGVRAAMSVRSSLG